MHAISTNIKRLSTLLPILLVLAQTATAAGLPIPAPPKIDAKSYILQDLHSGRVLAQSNADTAAPPASLAKLMTAYVVFRDLRAGNIQLQDHVTVSEKAWRTKGSRMFIEVNKQVSVEDLLQGMIIQSGNDASVALAEHVAGSEEAFAQLMNNHSRRLGMTNSHFTNSTGLPDDDLRITAADIATVAAAIIREFPQYYQWYSAKSFTFNGIEQYNRNKLLWRDQSVDGVKTGYTEAAGYCLVTSAMRDGMRLISVVMGSKSTKTRAAQSQALLNYGFRFFETHRLYAAGEPLTRLRVWKGRTSELALGLGNDLYVTIPRKQYQHLKASMEVPDSILAPASKGQQIDNALVKVTLGNQVIAHPPLLALEDVVVGGLLQRLLDSVLLWWE